MVGTKPGTSFYDLYREVHALDKDTQMYNAKNIKTQINGKIYEIPMSLIPFKDFLLSVAPEDSSQIEALCRDIAVMTTTKMPAGAPTSLRELFDIIKNSRGFLNLVRKYLGITVSQYAESCRNPIFKSILFRLMAPQYSFFALVMMLETRMSGNAGYPIGGAYDVIGRMEALYRELGGKINFSSRVDKIIVNNGRANGLEVKGQVHQADAVVAACDMYDVLKNMLGGQYRHKQLDTLLESAELFPPLLVVSFGLNRKFNLPFSQDFECPEGIRINSKEISHFLNIRSFEFDPSSAPENCSSVMVMMNSSLDYWRDLRQSAPDTYRTRKEELAKAVAEALDKRIPGFKDSIEVTDVATPATYIRYANLYKGSWEGFAPIPSSLKYNIKNTIDGIKGLYLCGQWTTVGGGICSAIQSGKGAARAIIKYLK